jgi:hypothetical protein
VKARTKSERTRDRFWINGMPVDEDLLSRPDTKAGRLQRDCLQLIAEHERASTLPTNGRFLFYELVQRGMIEKAYCYPGTKDKKPRQPKDDISDALMHLRERGIIPWEWIEDETRHIYERRYARTAKQYLLDTIPLIRIDCWKGKLPPLVICESRATRGVLRHIADRYLVPITATNGQCGGFLVTDVVPYLLGNDRKVIYIGDFELRGPADQIEANTRRYIEKHGYRVFTPKTWTKIALTEKQVEADPALLKLKIEKKDARYKPPKPYEAVECEAVGQAQLQQIFSDVLDALLPEPLERVLAREQRQRAAMERTVRQGRRR